jgi:hypothetical protein
MEPLSSRQSLFGWYVDEPGRVRPSHDDHHVDYVRHGGAVDSPHHPQRHGNASVRLWHVGSGLDAQRQHVNIAGDDDLQLQHRRRHVSGDVVVGAKCRSHVDGRNDGTRK